MADKCYVFPNYYGVELHVTGGFAEHTMLSWFQLG